MSRLTIDTGTAGNPATGDSLRGAFTKVNTNFAELYAELGGDSLDAISFNNNTISTDITNANLILTGNGAGGVVIEDIEITGSTINVLTTNSNLTLDTNGTGKVIINGLSFPTADGTAGQVLKTDGAGNLSFTAVDPGTITIVGDDSSGTTFNAGETIKIAGTQNITTAVAGDTLTITGPNLSSYQTGATAVIRAQRTAGGSSNDIGLWTFTTISGSATAVAQVIVSSLYHVFTLTGFTSIPSFVASMEVQYSPAAPSDETDNFLSAIRDYNNPNCFTTFTPNTHKIDIQVATTQAVDYYYYIRQ
jgi:hypothetical protein